MNMNMNMHVNGVNTKIKSVIFEPSGATEFDDPLLNPPDVIHLFGLGSLVDINGTQKIIGSGCLFSACIEAILLSLNIPFVSHIMDYRKKPAWFVKQFDEAFTPAIYFQGKYINNTELIINTILHKYSKEAKKCGFNGLTSEIPDDFHPTDTMMAVFFYLNYSPCDVDSVEYNEHVHKEHGRSYDSNEHILGRTNAAKICCEKLAVLEHVLSENMYCCGKSYGIADIIHFVILHILLDIMLVLFDRFLPDHHHEATLDVHRNR